MKYIVLFLLILVTTGCSQYKCIDGEVYRRLGFTSAYVKSTYYLNKCIEGKNAKP